ncbi:Serine/threonine protein kinase [Candidatus Sulfotelmatobacter kueseliae]|uniref:non-specific serine/threonine protein kinase n=1 Tax=Candidatus Sulfotelmatobacter kueseliae TaxID=2042962 RepID=A0A2U3KC45_9BACT|nr:Serine/threonine protein kinase [Candidatus Sulfotelmatobacter kueseliae]
MALTAGTKLGPYEIQSPLGAGGMGEVYRARDTRLDRSVAIKVLPAHLSSDPDLKLRLEREARAISSLQHPHICVLHDIGHQDGTDYLVMEYLEGETLADRLRKGPLPMEQVVQIGVEITDALDKAHRRGIIHRDLKPGNIMLTKSGAKLMDFGLAKPRALAAPAAADVDRALTPSSPTSPLAIPAREVSPLTVAGTVIGTYQYMAPEQIEGREADARSDIFALGAVLYEMATGQRAFEGKSQISVASAILEKDPPPISAIRAAVPPVLEHVISRALNKDPEKRWQSAGDIRAELQWAGSSGAALGASAGSSAATLGGRERWLVAIAAVVATVALIAAGVAFWRKPPEPRRLYASIAPPEDSAFELIGDVGAPPVISPDGTNLVFGAGGRIWIRYLESGDAHALEGTENGTFPFWSPDSRKIGFFSAGKLRIVDIAGGAPLPLCDAPNPRGGAWSPKGVLLFTPSIRSALYEVPATGGTPVQVTTLDTAKHSTHRWPQFLPDGDHFLYLATNHAGQRGFSGIYVGSLSRGGTQSQLLISTDADALYASGYVLFLRKNDLMAQRFDLGSLSLRGDAVRLADKVLNDQGIWRGAFTASENGLLTYAVGANAAEEGQLTWFEANGKVLGTMAERGSNSPRISPDGNRVALEFGVPNPNIWIFDSVRGLRTRLTTDVASSPVWSRDGKSIVYMIIPMSTNKARLAVRPADGSGNESLFAQDDQWESPTDWSPDGKYILYDRGEPGATDVYVMPIAADQKPFPFVATPAWERSGAFSPDGHWVAYTSRESGRDEVYVAPFPGPGQKWQVSSNGAVSPRWRRDGKALVAVNGDDILEFPISTANGSIQSGEPKVLFSTAIGQTLLFDVGWDVAPDGRLLINSLGKSRAGSRPLMLVVNWPAGLAH